jgi:hypothetical protein
MCERTGQQWRRHATRVSEGAARRLTGPASTLTIWLSSVSSIPKTEPSTHCFGLQTV